jgi:hypothetical protein
MTPADRILKAAHMEIERSRLMLDGLRLDDTHQVVIRVKPRGPALRVSLAVETVERSV